MSQPPPPGGGPPPQTPPPGSPPPGGMPPGGGYSSGPPPAQVPPPPHQEITWATAAHWSSLVAYLVGLPFLGPLVVMLTQGQRSWFVRRHAVESLNFQLSVMIYTLVLVVGGMISALVTFGLSLILVIPLLLGIAVAALVLVILATMAASRGEDYRYPLTIRMVT